MSKQPTFKTLRRKADSHFSRKCRTLGYCRNCNATKNLQWCHIISRKYYSLRYHKDNCVCLCASCHAKFTDNPIAFADFLKKILPAKVYNYFKKGRFDNVKNTKKLIEEILEKENIYIRDKKENNSKVRRKLLPLQGEGSRDTPLNPEHDT